MTLLLLACSGKDGGESTPPRDDSATDSAAGDSGPPAPVDADGDSSFDDEDCDDGNPWAYPGAVEYCDAVDQDCDGDPLTPGVCATAVEPDAAATWIIRREDGASGGFGMTRDLTGDGRDDFQWGHLPNEGFDVVSGGAMPAALLQSPDDAWFNVNTSRLYLTGGKRIDVGDVNGDGQNDFGAVNYDGSEGIYLLFGPFTEGEERDLWDADAVWQGYPQYEGNWATHVVSGTDFDGDGLADAIVSNLDDVSDEDYPGYDVDLYFGGEWDEQCWMGNHGGGRVELLGDLDGDGAEDIFVLAQQPFLLSGGELRGACGSSVEDIAFAWMPEANEADIDELVNRLYDDWRSMGDLSGDGLDDVIAGAPGSTSAGSGFGEIYVFGGGLRGEFDQTNAIGSWVGAVEAGGLGGALYTADFDGDRVLDIFTSGAGAPTDSWSVFQALGVPALREELPARRIVHAYGLPNIPPGDFDGDGRADLFHVDESNGVTIGILRGFDVPWDDATYW